MPKNTTIYDLLISCPGDVLEYVSVIEECVENFNKSIGNLNNIRLETKHWSKDSYPQSGGKAQELLNNQFVRDCDAAIAIFWTKFGTPTEKYGSGTEEEIEEMLSMDKQVFMYFLEAPIIPSEHNPDQYQKVQNFKEKYQNIGLYTLVNGKDDFHKQLTNHLSLYFLQLITKKDTTDDKMRPILTIRDLDASSEDKVSLVKTNLLKSRFIKGKKDKIIENINTLNDNVLPVTKDEKLNIQEGDIKERNITYKFHNSQKTENVIDNVSIFGSEYVKVNDNLKNTVNSFAYNNDIKLHEDFWNIGNLKIRNSTYRSIFSSNGSSFVGTDEEKNYYFSLRDLYRSIEGYNQYVDYLGYIDNVDFLKLRVSNLGTKYDEDIDVKLLIPKGCLLKHDELPYPGIDIIDEVLSNGLINYAFSFKDSDSYNKYEFTKPNSPSFNHMNRSLSLSILEKSRDDQYEDNKEDYRDSLDTIFQYKIVEKSDSDVLMFNIDYLKHNTSIAFPSALMFKDIPELIEYEINSKNIPEVIKGKLILKN